METTVQAPTGAETVRRLAETRGEPQWLAEWRLHAWDTFEVAPLPDRVVHLWRYSEPEKFLTDKVGILTPELGTPSTELPDGFTEQASAVLSLANGVATHAWIAPEWREAGLIVADLGTAIRDHGDLVREWLGRAVNADSGKFEALNAAMFAGGAFVYVPRNVQLDRPIHLVHRADGDRVAAFPRVVLAIDQGSEAVVIDEYTSSDEARVLANSVVEGVVEPNAKLGYFNIQLWGSKVRSHARQRFLVQRDATVTTVNIGLGGQYSKSNLSNVQQGNNAASEMVGVTFGSDTQHFDIHTEHIHEVGNSFSDMDFKVVLENEAHSIYTGLIRIDLEARNSEAYQENRNLMLDPTCRAESIPELEILNEDVQCTHGATVGPIDEEQVYYLQTRGLARRDAEHLIVEGFFGPALDRIEDEELRERLWRYVNAKLASRS